MARNAGNLIDTAVVGTVEYGAAVLGAPLIVVLGHQRCGAVEAACDVVAKNATFPGSIGPMIDPILPAAIADARPARRFPRQHHPRKRQAQRRPADNREPDARATWSRAASSRSSPRATTWIAAAWSICT